MSALVAQFLKFATAGGIATSLHYAVLILLVQAAGVDAVAASGAGFAVGAVTNHLLNYRYTFASTRNHADAFARFIAVSVHSAPPSRGAPPGPTLVTIEEPVGGSSDGTAQNIHLPLDCGSLLPLSSSGVLRSARRHDS